MSEKDFISKLWKSVIGAIVTIVISSIIMMMLSFQATSERTKQNSERIDNLDKEIKLKANIGDDNGIHLMLLERMTKNEESIIKLQKENDETLRYLIEKIDRVNQNILDLHKK
jgi:Na+/melibiose symporter-like transporter